MTIINDKILKSFISAKKEAIKSAYVPSKARFKLKIDNNGTLIVVMYDENNK